MHYLGQWGGGGPGHSLALKWHRAKRVPFGPRSVQGTLPPLAQVMHKLIPGPYCCVGPILLCGAHTVVLWWRFQLVGAGLGGGGGFDPSLAVRWLAHTTHSISCLDSSSGRVPACDAGDPDWIPGGGKFNVCPLPGGQLTSTHYSQYKLSR